MYTQKKTYLIIWAGTLPLHLSPIALTEHGIISQNTGIAVNVAVFMAFMAYTYKYVVKKIVKSLNRGIEIGVVWLGFFAGM